MGDPFSAVGSAVGVISLGLQVCGGLLSYYKAFKSYNDYGARIYGKLEGLQNTLQYLEDTLKNLSPSHHSATRNARKHIIACEHGFQALKNSWEECERVATSAPSKDWMQNLSRRAAFPFKKSKMQDTEVALTDLQQNLDTALQALQM